MFSFEDALKFIVVMGTGSFVLVMIGLGVKLIFFRKPQTASAVDAEQLEGLDERVLRTEAKMAELEERMDFAERLLTEARAKQAKLGP